MRAENKGAGERKRKVGKESKADPPAPKRYNMRFKTADDVRRMLSVTLNDLRRGGIDVQVARALIYGGQVLLNVFEQCELGERVKKLEALTQYGGQQ
jgi:hypothetical protein